MLFNSLAYLWFFPLVFVLYWWANNRSLRFQNIILLIASYYFYSCWDWRFLFLLVFSTVLDYGSGIAIHKADDNNRLRRFWLVLSVGINLGFLGVFKYYNFFAESFADLISLFGLKPHINTLNVILPVGISFYTFHGLSYVFDIYNRKIVPTTNFVNYSLFVSFFPLLVAGPIERATHLLPQLERKRTFDYHKAVDGLRQILWGLFKKVIIADSCAEYANMIFNNSAEYSGSTLIVGAIMFTFQIYGDFSGYSDIALGSARLLGIELLQNFRFPYFSRDIAEFWRRWHISLSSWFKDYLYIPLGGSKGGNWMRIRNTFIIFLVSGFWHGANWTFIVWGGLNALFIMPSIMMKTNRNNIEIVAKGKLLPSFRELLQVAITFGLAVFAWIFFRADNLSHALSYASEIFTLSTFSKPAIFPKTVFALIGFFMLIEWLGRESNYALERFAINWYRPLRYGFYLVLTLAILIAGGKEQEFIYFQF